MRRVTGNLHTSVYSYPVHGNLGEQFGPFASGPLLPRIEVQVTLEVDIRCCADKYVIYTHTSH